MTARAEWLEAMKGADVATVARALGIEVTATRGSVSPGNFPCPACGAAKRHTKSGDRRGACSIAPGGATWGCFQCESKGDALELVRIVEGEGRRDWCMRWLGIDARGPSSPRPARPVVAPKPAPAQEPNYPPRGEVAALFASCVPVDADAGVSEYLRSRGIDPAIVARDDLARALPPSAPCPRWAYHAPEGKGSYGSWARTNHRLLVPVLDAMGVTRSIVARRADRRKDDPRKSTAPSLYHRAGLVMPCPIAFQLLKRGAWPAVSIDFPPGGVQKPLPWPTASPLLVITEGEVDFLAWCCAASDANETPHATIGLYSGGWDPNIATRVPDGTRVLVATDDDEEGDGYAAKIVASFKGRSVRTQRHRYRHRGRAA